MKRYLLFAGDCYYPCGGWSDFRGSFDNLDEARELAMKDHDPGWDWFHIVDTQTMRRYDDDGANR